MHLDTQRLVIRSFTAQDVPAYAALVADPEVMTSLGDGQPLEAASASSYVQQCISNEQRLGFARYALALQRTNTFIGFCGYAVINDDVDLGYRLAREHWGHGYALEAAQAVIAYGFDTLGLDAIVATAYTANRRSIRVIEQLGFAFERLDTLNGHDAMRYSMRRPVVV